MSEGEISAALMEPNTQIFQQAMLSATRSSQARSTLAEVQSRHNDIVVIERKIEELAQLFNELSVVVELHDVHIDQIDQQVSRAENSMSNAVKEQDRAINLLRSIRRKKWWCFGIMVLIIIIIVVIVVVVEVVNKKTS